MKKYTYHELFEAYQLPLYRYLLQLSRNKEVAEDLLQETFYRAMVSLKVKHTMQAKAWLFKVARNLYIDSTRKRNTEQKVLNELMRDYSPATSIGNPEQSLEKKTKQEELEALLSMLPENMQTILYLREVQGFSYKELALAMDLTENQVKVTLHRARIKFREYASRKKGAGIHEE
ncbi:sigma-70 family RNA polymerase sigma factor [Ornithinibacillus sp. L9]|uniref:Sigma-70 family RNA polymerase sigma factor n=1 Tax=Ornithinibacillus caprae TaxID=2678566 RepID=A0A6N8FRC3_9BACI|nr:sigma-70 family RNA polymerase sigma factor [Ornithinibacillus caprae]MUK90779.1 sigma-70 family RNA polymerase sigma factor [Ornithinibacillus caprae]